MREPLYEVTGRIWGKRFSESVHTLEEARAIVIKQTEGTIWFHSVQGRKRVETREQAMRNGKGGAA
jgi:hypothetical protein